MSGVLQKDQLKELWRAWVYKEDQCALESLRTHFHQTLLAKARDTIGQRRPDLALNASDYDERARAEFPDILKSFRERHTAYLQYNIEEKIERAMEKLYARRTADLIAWASSKARDGRKPEMEFRAGQPPETLLQAAERAYACLDQQERTALVARFAEGRILEDIAPMLTNVNGTKARAGRAWTLSERGRSKFLCVIDVAAGPRINR